MQIALIILACCALIMAPTILFLLVIHPIWAVVEVCGSALIGRGQRIVWLLMLLILATVASVPYAIFVTASGALRKVTIICILTIGLVASAGYAIVTLNPRLQSDIIAGVQQAAESYGRYEDVLRYAKQLGFEY